MYRHLTIIKHGLHVCLAHVGLVGVPGQAGGGHRVGEGDGLGQGQDGEVVPGHCHHHHGHHCHEVLLGGDGVVERIIQDVADRHPVVLVIVYVVLAKHNLYMGD